MKKKITVFLKKIGRRYCFFSNKWVVSFVGKIELSKNMSISDINGPLECYSIIPIKIPRRDKKKKRLFAVFTEILRQKVKQGRKCISDVSFEMDGFEICLSDMWADGVSMKDKEKGFCVQVIHKNPEDIFDIIRAAKSFAKNSYYCSYDMEMMGWHEGASRILATRSCHVNNSLSEYWNKFWRML